MRSCAWKHDHARQAAVKTFSARKQQLGYKSRRMDIKPDDSVGRFNVPPGCLSFKETTRNQ